MELILIKENTEAFFYVFKWDNLWGKINALHLSVIAGFIALEEMSLLTTDLERWYKHSPKYWISWISFKLFCFQIILFLFFENWNCKTKATVLHFIAMTLSFLELS